MPRLKDVIEDLIDSFGLRESISDREYACIRYNFLLKEYGQCIKRIKKFLKLEMVEVNIRYVNNEEMLMVLTDEEKREMVKHSSPDELWHGDKCHEVPMRISVSKSIPPYGAKEFRGFPVFLLINKDFVNNSFDQFMVNAAHEMNHVLLHATRHRWQHSEKAVDLLLMLQGFMEINERIYADGTYRSYLSPEEVRGICWYLRKRRR